MGHNDPHPWNNVIPDPMGNRVKTFRVKCVFCVFPTKQKVNSYSLSQMGILVYTFFIAWGQCDSLIGTMHISNSKLNPILLGGLFKPAV